jgi:hypothetical protein
MVPLLVGKRCRARGDEEKVGPSVHVLTFEIKVMRQTLKHTMNQHQNRYSSQENVAMPAQSIWPITWWIMLS